MPGLHIPDTCHAGAPVWPGSIYLSYLAELHLPIHSFRFQSTHILHMDLAKPNELRFEP